MSLDRVETISDIDSFFCGIDDSPVCLIEGFSAPTNGTALKNFLQKRRISSPKIFAIDILDMASVFSTYGIFIQDVNFSLADAADLQGIYKDKTVDLIVQDFLLNCAPHAVQRLIIREAARILNPCGTFIISFTDSEAIGSIDVMTYEELKNKFGIAMNESAYCIRDLKTENDDIAHLLAVLCGKVIVDETGERFTLVTPPHGNFEFFTSFQNVKNLLNQFGLGIVAMDQYKGRDRNGISCTRYRTIVQKRKK